MKKQSYVKIVLLQVLILFLGSCESPKKVLPFYPATVNKSFPLPQGYVNDFEGILTVEQEKEIAAMIEVHAKETTNQIAIVTLTSVIPYENLFDYSLELAKYWGVGQTGRSGVLIAFGKGIREIRIQNSHGIEKMLTDEETKKIIDQKMVPNFKEDRFYEGLKEGIAATIKELE